MSKNSVIAIAIVCVILFGLIVGGSIMIFGGKGDSNNYNAEFADGTKLTWEELMKEENGTKFGYDYKAISNEEIGVDAFKGSELVYIKVPKTVKNISTTAFNNASKLQTIAVVSTNEVYASTADGALYFKATTTLQTVPAGKTGPYVIANGTIAIGDYAFANCTGITEITIPETVKTIGKNAFEGIKIEKLSIPMSVESIGRNAFANIEKMKIEYPGTMKEWCQIIGYINLADMHDGLEVSAAPNKN